MDVTYLDLELLLLVVDEPGLQAVQDVGLLESIVRNDPLIDGNKRLGWIAAKTFYALHGVALPAPHDAAYDLVIGIAEGRVDYHESAARLAAWTSTST